MNFVECLRQYTLPLFIVLLAYLVNHPAESSSPSLLSSSTCIPGCKCSAINEAAVCCLFNSQNKSNLQEPQSQQQHDPFSQDFCALPTHSPSPRWPDSFICLPSWRQLKIHLFEHSWLTLITLHTNSTYSCNQNLERLILVGLPGIKDDLYKLEPFLFRNLFFPLPEPVRLSRLTIEQTSLTEISSGFFDQLRTNQLTDLEIRRNPSLTSDHLGIGWLANLDKLKLLDLSQNRLYTINLARWGFSKSKPSLLITLDLSGNRIAQLKPDTFQRVPNLIQLYLADNLLSNLPLTIFNNLNHLRLLDLQGNRLKLIGLDSPDPSLAVTLPDLRHLKLSRNPLIDLSTNLTSNWWLTSSCPTQLTTLYMEQIDVSPPSLTSAPELRLPPIAWNYCSSLVELRLSQIHPLNCLNQSWLGVGWDTIRLPTRFRIYPPNLDLCTPRTRSLRIEKDLPMDHIVSEPSLIPTSLPNAVETTTRNRYSNSNYRAMHNKFQPTPVSFNSAYWPTVTDHSARVVHLRSTSFLSSWLILSLIILLLLAIFLMIAFSIFYCIRNQHYQQQHQHHHQHLKKSFANLIPDHPPPMTSSNLNYLNSLGSRKPDMSLSQSNIHSHISSIEPLNLNYPHYLNFNSGQLPHHFYDSQHNHHDQLLHRFIPTQPVSPGDSGLEDLTPLNYPQSIHTIPRLSPSSTRTSIRLGRKSKQTTRRSKNSNSIHGPSTSFTSLVSGRLLLPIHPNESVKTTPLWFSSLGLEPHSMMMMTTNGADRNNSIENMSLDPSTNPTSTTLNQLSSTDATDTGSVPSQSDKATLIVMSEHC